MAAFLVKPIIDPIPTETNEEIIEKIINNDGLIYYSDRNIPIVAVCKEGIKFERPYTFGTQIDKKRNIWKRIEYKVTAVIPLKSRFIRSHDSFIRSVIPREVRKYLTVIYVGTSYGPAM